MRASKNSSSNASSDDIRARYLGEIAPLLDAAREIDSLSPAQTKQVRRRIVRTLFRTRLLSFRVRLVPVLAALGMLVIGGAAFATAERLGLLPKLGTKAPTAPAAQPKQETRKHRGSGTPPAAREGAPGAPVATVSEATPASPITLVLPEVPGIGISLSSQLICTDGPPTGSKVSAWKRRVAGWSSSTKSAAISS